MLIQLPQYMDLQVFVSQKRLTKQFQAILGEISSIVLKSDDTATFDAAAATFALCIEKYSDLAASAVGRASLWPHSSCWFRRPPRISLLMGCARECAPRSRTACLRFRLKLSSPTASSWL